MLTNSNRILILLINVYRLTQSSTRKDIILIFVETDREKFKEIAIEAIYFVICECILNIFMYWKNSGLYTMCSYFLSRSHFHSFLIHKNICSILLCIQWLCASLSFFFIYVVPVSYFIFEIPYVYPIYFMCMSSRRKTYTQKPI